MNRKRQPRTPLTAGRLWYLAYHAPLSWLARSHREGGPWQQWKNARGMAAMKRAASELEPLPPAPIDATPIYFLTGKRFWFQTAFCFWTLQRQSLQRLRLVMVDDGTIDADVVGNSQRLFPGASILNVGTIERRLDEVLPEAKFPFLRAQRRTYVHLRKLTDVHAGTVGWKLVMDSDMLFFRPPDSLEEWLRTPTRPIHLEDIQDAYGYPLHELERLAVAPIPSRINVGILGLQSDQIDWQRVEDCCRQLIEIHGTSYYLEQALCALILSASESTIRLGRNDYQVMPTMEESANPTAVMHHYVAESKAGYFRHAWKNACGRSHRLAR